ncbi:AAA family ATPase [Shimia haliotis]|uniref:AAA family ATPase n=1 Tax=Shimia haliotis TaxID=1280847 RepID=UPI001BB0CE6C|nr:AAA family ATPase [Shimia haliotis]
MRFTTPVTILIGENGAGKSTLVEAIAALSGYDEAGGGKGYLASHHGYPFSNPDGLAECPLA